MGVPSSVQQLSAGSRLSFKHTVSGEDIDQLKRNQSLTLRTGKSVLSSKTFTVKLEGDALSFKQEGLVARVRRFVGVGCAASESEAKVFYAKVLLLTQLAGDSSKENAVYSMRLLKNAVSAADDDKAIEQAFSSDSVSTENLELVKQSYKTKIQSSSTDIKKFHEQQHSKPEQSIRSTWNAKTGIEPHVMYKSSSKKQGQNATFQNERVRSKAQSARSDLLREQTSISDLRAEFTTKVASKLQNHLQINLSISDIRIMRQIINQSPDDVPLSLKNLPKEVLIQIITGDISKEYLENPKSITSSDLQEMKQSSAIKPENALKFLSEFKGQTADSLVLMYELSCQLTGKPQGWEQQIQPKILSHLETFTDGTEAIKKLPEFAQNLICISMVNKAADLPSEDMKLKTLCDAIKLAITCNIDLSDSVSIDTFATLLQREPEIAKQLYDNISGESKKVFRAALSSLIVECKDSVQLGSVVESQKSALKQMEAESANKIMGHLQDCRFAKLSVELYQALPKGAQESTAEIMFSTLLELLPGQGALFSELTHEVKNQFITKQNSAQLQSLINSKSKSFVETMPLIVDCVPELVKGGSNQFYILANACMKSGASLVDVSSMLKTMSHKEKAAACNVVLDQIEKNRTSGDAQVLNEAQKAIIHTVINDGYFELISERWDKMSVKMKSAVLLHEPMLKQKEWNEALLSSNLHDLKLILDELYESSPEQTKENILPLLNYASGDQLVKVNRLLGHYSDDGLKALLTNECIDFIFDNSDMLPLSMSRVMSADKFAHILLTKGSEEASKYFSHVQITPEYFEHLQQAIDKIGGPQVEEARSKLKDSKGINVKAQQTINCYELIGALDPSKAHNIELVVGLIKRNDPDYQKHLPSCAGYLVGGAGEHFKQYLKSKGLSTEQIQKLFVGIRKHYKDSATFVEHMENLLSKESKQALSEKSGKRIKDTIQLLIALSVCQDKLIDYHEKIEELCQQAVALSNDRNIKETADTIAGIGSEFILRSFMSKLSLTKNSLYNSAYLNIDSEQL
ncbi:hypothetical protein SOPP22_19195 [Shewanella sp. OPT22]|nr:hypothetical protein SOPP22_19195 [Shewanella sp. OPT22]